MFDAFFRFVPLKSAATPLFFELSVLTRGLNLTAKNVKT